MKRWGRLVGAASLALLLAVFLMVQPSYFFAKPSLYSLFSAVVADRGVHVERDISFGDDSRLKLDVYTPRQMAQTATSPVVVFLYGGTWKEGEKSIYGFLGSALAARGITTVIPDYRLYPDVQFPEFLSDAAQAFVWARRQFSASGTEPERPIIVMGHSAGAHMAAMLAFNPAYINAVDSGAAKPAGLIGLAGPYVFDLTDYPSTRDLFVKGQNPEETIPATYVTGTAPPALLLHGSADETVKLANQQVLAERLRALNVRVETHEPEGETHVGVVRALAWPFRNSSPVIDLIVQFVQRIARDAKG